MGEFMWAYCDGIMVVRTVTYYPADRRGVLRYLSDRQTRLRPTRPPLLHSKRPAESLDGS